MGASFFRTSQRGKSLSDAYKRAVEDAEQEYGHDPYNGTISTTHGVIDKTKEFRASKKIITDFIDGYVDKGEKRQCFAVCIEQPIENKNKTKSKVEHVVTPGTKKWVLKYVVYSIDGVIGSYLTKGEAVKAARAHTEKYLSSTTIQVEKMLDRGSALVAKISYKRSDKERDGKWIFFGWAAE